MIQRKPGYLYDEGCATLLVVLIVLGIIFAILYYSMVFWTITVSLLILTYVLLGFKSVPTAHKGILTYFGKRTNAIYDEGLAWHPPLLSTIEIVDFRKRFIADHNEKFFLANLLYVETKLSVFYSVSNIKKYFENQSHGSLNDQIISDVSAHLREYIINEGYTEAEFVGLNNEEYLKHALSVINSRFIHNLGLKIDDILLKSNSVSEETRLMHSLIYQADLLFRRDNISYNEALKNALIVNEHVTQTFSNFDSDTLIQALMQFKRMSPFFR